MKKSIFKFLTFGFAAFAVLSCFSGCNNDSSSGSSEPSITNVSVVAVNKEIEASGTTELVATVEGENLEGYNFSYDWNVEKNPETLVATITNDESKTTKNTATLSVTNVSAQSGTVKVKVTVTIEEKNGTTLAGDNAKKTSDVVEITVKGSSTTTTYEIGGNTVVVSSDGKATVTDASGNTVEAIVETSEDGTVTIKGSDGKTLYTATATEDGKIDTESVKDADGKTVEVEEKIISVESITLNKTEASVEEESSVLLIATIGPYNASDKTVTWTTSDPSIATVENGNVTGVKAGKATITAKAGEKTAIATITVTEKATTEPSEEPDEDDKNSYTVTVIDSDGKEVSGTITQSNGEILFTNPNPVTSVSNIASDIWKYHVKIALPSDVKKGKNYKVSADIKADKETSYFELETKDDFTYNLGNREFNDKITKDYATYSVTTGTASFDWTKGVLNIAAGTISKLYIKNIKVEEISDVQNFGTHKVPNSNKNLSTDLTITENASANTLTLEFASANEINDLGADIVLLNEPLDVGSLYKVSLNIMSDVTLFSGEINIWGHVIGDECETAGSSRFSFDANTKKNITLYLPVYPKENETVRVPFIYLSSSRAAKITISDLKAEKVTDLEKEFGNSELSLWYAGRNGSIKDVSRWGLHENGEVMIPAKSGQCYGQLILSDDDNWSSTKNAVTSFRVLEKGTGSDLNLNPSVKNLVNDGYNFVFENTSDKDIAVKFGFNEKFEVTITRGTLYTISYNGDEVESVTESELHDYESWYELTEVTDYTLNGTTIALTESGYKKIFGETETVTICVIGEYGSGIRIGLSSLSGFVSARGYTLYSDEACTNQITDFSTIKVGDIVYAKVPEVDVSSLYVKGSFNRWSDNSDYQLNDYKTEADGSKIYEMSFTATGSTEEFKVANSNWSIEYSNVSVSVGGDFVELTRSMGGSANSTISGLTPYAEYKLTIKENGEGLFIKVTLTKPAEEPVETTYTVVYEGKELTKIPEAGLSAYETSFGLVEGTDYSIDAKTIKLTESGYSKFISNTVTVINS